MREQRRLKNDEYQFETYHADILHSGEAFKGEWTVYKTNTFLEGMEDDHDKETGLPRFVKGRRTMKVVTSGKKVVIPTESQYRLDAERIIHTEQIANKEDLKEIGENSSQYNDPSDVELEIIRNTYWPDQLSSLDFRGPAGIMCVGKSYTICNAIPLDQTAVDKDSCDDTKYDGPFSELKTELGIQYKRMRFRVKLDYRAKGYGPNDDSTAFQQEQPQYPLLHLCSMTVCRETRERWPRYTDDKNTDDAVSENLFGPPGAPGGLYDAPPVGSEEQSMQYMMMDLEGGATVLFPHKIDQDPSAFDGHGWVTSLDWTPGRIRYQVDRKVMGGTKVRGLRTLELSEVQSEDADKWRPKDGGTNMRQ
mmetsp:Transcript_21369/g.29954  ORF Transcript_21369/g.29954 Transcript_21369/m.29954 type:complete len:363 (+) Transcript_21369:110-1198(+)